MIEESGRSYISPAGAAQQLGISPRRVYELAKANRLVSIRLGGRLLIAAHSVDALAGGGQRVGRPLSPRRAWGLILLASGEDPHALDPVTKSKLRRMLRERNLWSIRARLSGRAAKQGLRAHPSDLRRIDADPALVRTGPRFAHEAGIPLVASDATSEYYVDPKTAALLISRYRLSSSSDPNVIFRVVSAEVWPWLSHAVAPRVAVALDVAEDGDARSRNAAQSVLAGRRALDTSRHVQVDVAGVGGGELPVPSVAGAIAIKLQAWGTRRGQRDLEDLVRLLGIVDDVEVVRSELKPSERRALGRIAALRDPASPSWRATRSPEDARAALARLHDE